MNMKQIKNKLIEYDYKLTTNPMESIYIFPDGSMIDGGFDCGSRGEDHRMIECLMESDRYDNHFWDDVHIQLNVVRLVPESMIALISKGQQLTKKQLTIINKTEYLVEEY